MPDREKVMKGLEVCTTKPCYCTDCPYKKTCALDSQELMEDALALLKEQEPRVMTLQEVRESFGHPMWLESCGTFWGEKGWWCLSHGTMMPFDIVISMPKADEPIRLGLADYNNVWRAWTSRPSPEQMRETKWEGDKE